jgi:hypothetical protein
MTVAAVEARGEDAATVVATVTAIATAAGSTLAGDSFAPSFDSSLGCSFASSLAASNVADAVRPPDNLLGFVTMAAGRLASESVPRRLPARREDAGESVASGGASAEDLNGKLSARDASADDADAGEMFLGEPNELSFGETDRALGLSAMGECNPADPDAAAVSTKMTGTCPAAAVGSVEDAATGTGGAGAAVD